MASDFLKGADNMVGLLSARRHYNQQGAGVVGSGSFQQLVECGNETGRCFAGAGRSRDKKVMALRVMRQ